MNEPCAKITLDVQQASTSTFVAVKRGDIGRKIVITLSDGGFPYDIAADCYAVLTGTKPDGNILYNHCDIVGNTIVYEITEQTTAAAGRMKAEVKLYGADDILVTSATFRIIIDGTVYTDSQVESSSEFSALTQLISQVVEIIRKYSDVTTVTKTSELINDSGFITNTVSDLVNYYTKTDIGNLLSNIPKFRISAVSVLPTEDISETTIYLLSGGAGSDLYTEYLRVDGKWEILGSQRVDLTGYATEEWVEQKLEGHSGGNADQNGSNGLSSTEKTLMLSLFKNSIFATDMTSTIAQLEAYWNGSGETEVTLASISATYSGGDVAVGTAVSALTGITVKATYSDGSVATVTGYTLSGEIVEGNNTITVSYNDMTTTFTVTGVADADSGDETEPVVYTITNSLTNTKTNNTDTSTQEGSGYVATITANNGYELESVTVTMGGVDITSTAYSNGIVTIDAVTGDVVITAVAVEVEVSYTLPSWIAEMEVIEFTPEADTNEAQTFAINMDDAPNLVFVNSDFEAPEKTRDFVGMFINKAYSGRCDAFQYHASTATKIASQVLTENGTTVANNEVVIKTGNIGTEAACWRAGHTYKIYCIKTALDISSMNDVPFANEVCAIEYEPEADTNEAVTFNYEMENEPNTVLILSDFAAFEKYRDIVGVLYTNWYESGRAATLSHNSTTVACGNATSSYGYVTAENGVLTYVPQVAGGTACYFRAEHKYMILLMNM